MTRFSSVADDHDVLKFATHSLKSPDAGGNAMPDAAAEAESKKFEEEFDQYQEKLKTQKEQWAKEHPDQVSVA